MKPLSSFIVRLGVLAIFPALISGCGSSDRGPNTSDRQDKRPAKATPAAAREEPQSAQRPDSNAKALSAGQRDSQVAPLPDGPRTLADLLTDEDPNPDPSLPAHLASTPAAPPAGNQIPIDDTRAAVAGIRKLSGRYLTLYTDVPIGPKADELPDMFDLAVPQWCEYFGIEPARVADWHITGFLMQEKARFQATGLLPGGLPPFRHGYHTGGSIWIYDQPDAYYSRQLVLHEGTHAFMHSFLGGYGPPWYSEGMAELLGTYAWQNGRLTLGYFPKDKTETPGWGRIRIIQDELAAGRGKIPADILDYGSQAHLQKPPYGWCWGLTAFLDSHPQSRQIFRRLGSRIAASDVNTWLLAQLQDRWSALSEDWQVYVMDIHYGYDVARAAVVRKPATPLTASGASATIVADRGWQSTGIRLEGGVPYRLEASGRYQIAEISEVWWCEPGGVTIRYHKGRPLGMLVGAVRDDTRPLSGLSPLVRPETFGLQRTWTPQFGGTLYLKINEAAAGLSDNQGTIIVQVQTAK